MQFASQKQTSAVFPEPRRRVMTLRQGTTMDGHQSPVVGHAVSGGRARSDAVRGGGGEAAVPFGAPALRVVRQFGYRSIGVRSWLWGGTSST